MGAKEFQQIFKEHIQRTEKAIADLSNRYDLDAAEAFKKFLEKNPDFTRAKYVAVKILNISLEANDLTIDADKVIAERNLQNYNEIMNTANEICGISRNSLLMLVNALTKHGYIVVTDGKYIYPFASMDDAEK